MRHRMLRLLIIALVATIGVILVLFFFLRCLNPPPKDRNDA